MGYRHFHECSNCHFEYECDEDEWLGEYCWWNGEPVENQRCMDCEAD